MKLNNEEFYKGVKKWDAVIPGKGSGLFARSEKHRELFGQHSTYDYVGIESFYGKYEEKVTHLNPDTGETLFVRCATLSQYYKSEEIHGFTRRYLEITMYNANNKADSTDTVFEFLADKLVIHGHAGELIEFPQDSVNKYAERKKGGNWVLKFKIHEISSKGGTVLSKPHPNHNQLILF